MRVPAIVRLRLVLGCLLLAGCSGGRRVDALKDLGVELRAPTRELSIVIVHSENTKNSMSYMGAWRAGAGGYDNLKVFKDLPAILGRHFKSVVFADDLQAAQALKPNLIALVDAYAHHQGFGVGRVELDINIVFLTPEKREVESVRGNREAKIGLSGFTPVGPWVWGRAVRSMEEEVEGDLDAALRSSMRLADFAASRGAEAASPGRPLARVWVSDVDKPSYHEAENPDNIAVVVGVENYASMPEARFAERDAAAVREHLVALGFAPRNIRTLIGPQATRASLAKDLESWLPTVSKERSTVFFYYSGHGAPDLKTGQAYLVPWDGDAQFLADTALPLARVYERLNTLNARRIVVALDSCFSGRGARSLLPRGARPLVTKIDAGHGSLGKLAVLTASAEDEIAGTYEEQGHGIFTYYFLKGLSGAAADGNGAVTLKGLHAYLVPRVRDAAGRENRDQVPQLLPSAASSAADFRFK